MGGLTKFMNRYKKKHPGTDYTDEELKELWMDIANRGSLFYQKTKEENPEWSHGAICNDYMFGGGLSDLKGEARALYNHDGYVPGNLYKEYTWRDNLIGEFMEKDFNCGCLPGQKCPEYYKLSYRISKYCKAMKMDHHYWRYEYGNESCYIDVEKVRYYKSKLYCNYYKKQPDPDNDDTYDTKPAREIPLSGSV